MGRYVLAIAAGFFCASTLLMTAFLFCQLNAGRKSEDAAKVAEIAVLPQAATGGAIPPDLAAGPTAEVTDARSRNHQFHFATATAFFDETPKGKARWDSGIVKGNEFDVELTDGMVFLIKKGQRLFLNPADPPGVIFGRNQSDDGAFELPPGDHKTVGDSPITIRVREENSDGVYDATELWAGTISAEGGAESELDDKPSQTILHRGPMAKLTFAGPSATAEYKVDGKEVGGVETTFETVGEYKLFAAGTVVGYGTDGTQLSEGVPFVANKTLTIETPANVRLAPNVGVISREVAIRNSESSEEATLVTSAAATLTQPMLLQSGTIQVVAMAAEPGRPLSVMAGSSPPLRAFKAEQRSAGESESGEPDNGEIVFELTPDSGTETYFVVDTWSKQRSNPFRIAVSRQSIFEPRILYHGAGTKSDIEIGEASIPVQVSTISVSGLAQSADRAELLIFQQVQQTDDFAQSAPPLPLTIGNNGIWQQTVSLPEGPGTYQLMAVAHSNNDHSLSSAVKFETKPNDVGAVRLAIDQIKFDDPSTDDASKLLPAVGGSVGNSTVSISFTATKAEPGDVLLVRRNGVALNQVTLPKQSIDVTELNAGANSLEFVVQRGGAESPAVRRTLNVVETGPKVISVKPDPLGHQSGKASLRIRFDANHPLDETSANNETNYVLVPDRGRNRGEKIHPKTVRFDATTNEVVLFFNENLGLDVYELRINGHRENEDSDFFSGADDALGVKDRLGNLLNGAEGRGTDHVRMLDGSGGASSSGAGLVGVAGFRPRARVELSPVTAEAPNPLTTRVGLPETTGEQVVYPEFTQPRGIINGFNPSDKVVTRVARLYYFRDAHRVTQIINRKAKSYNSQNATMSRQLADKARIFADQTTDRRRSAERRAVESAQYAREAENALRKYQQEATRTAEDLRQGNDRKRSLEQVITRLEASEDSADAERLITAREQLAALDDVIRESEQQLAVSQERANATTAAIEALRERELQDREVMEQELAKEDRAVEEQFRLEVRAANEDPDTYAEGEPNSDDPVAQVTLTVIGEGLIQMRGPRKGVNIVHTMINQIDAPVGQVRVDVHTVQVNGEKGPQMENIVGRMGGYVAQSRFLTAQTKQMLRNAIATVASRKAQEAGFVCDGVMPVSGVESNGTVLSSLSTVSPQHRYQDAFFGQEFMNELRQMDSEFLKTGNKLLSLHSMDTTSLASALFVLAVANNDTRMEILETFRHMMECDLPMREMDFITASLAPPAKKKSFFSLGRCDGECRTRTPMLAQNARFVSLSGYFDGRIEGAHTLNPAQREFIKLAQILKSRLITEIELKHRVLERSVIEERLGDYQTQLKVAQRREAEADEQLRRHQEDFQKELNSVLTTAREIAGKYAEEIAEVKKEFSAPDNTGLSALDYQGATIDVDSFMDEHGIPKSLRNSVSDSLKEGEAHAKAALVEAEPDRFLRALHAATDGTLDSLYPEAPRTDILTLRSNGKLISIDRKGVVKNTTANQNSVVDARTGTQKRIDDVRESVAIKHLTANQQKSLRYSLDAITRQLTPDEFNLAEILSDLVKLQTYLESNAIGNLKKEMSELDRQYRRIFDSLRDAADAAAEGRNDLASQHLSTAHQVWVTIRPLLQRRPFPSLGSEVRTLNEAFSKLLQADLGLQFAQSVAREARRPLDHKKFLDMLIDDTEEKFIELVEGTRAQTAVIDDYIKRIATALDDDLNAQFYEPAFRNIREETYGCYGVNFGQIEHTNVLTNNRMFAKVRPQATMEFDLPRRRIMIAEAMQSARAAYNDFGALMNDPGFLALTKLHSGQPTAATHNSDGSLVRDVLPGLPSQNGEGQVAQSASSQPEFDSQLEALIPDPAIYKFETGTGYEIRPVIQPDGQSVVFDFNYMYTTNIREPVRADEKHLGRVKRHFIDTDVQIGNYELREVSRYRVALKASRTSRGVPLLEDIPVAGALFRPQPSEESSLQQNIILAKSVIFPTLYDLMGLRWAPAVADLDTEDLKHQEFIYRNRMKWIRNEVYDYSSTQVDEFLRVPTAERRADLYRPQNQIPRVHPDGQQPLGNNRFDSQLQEGYGPVPNSDAGLRHVAPALPNELQQGSFSPPIGKPVDSGDSETRPAHSELTPMMQEDEDDSVNLWIPPRSLQHEPILAPPAMDAEEWKDLGTRQVSTDWVPMTETNASFEAEKRPLRTGSSKRGPEDLDNALFERKAKEESWKVTPLGVVERPAASRSGSGIQQMSYVTPFGMSIGSREERNSGIVSATYQRPSRQRADSMGSRFSADADRSRGSSFGQPSVKAETKEPRVLPQFPASDISVSKSRTPFVDRLTRANSTTGTQHSHRFAESVKSSTKTNKKKSTDLWESFR